MYVHAQSTKLAVQTTKPLKEEATPTRLHNYRQFKGEKSTDIIKVKVLYETLFKTHVKAVCSKIYANKLRTSLNYFFPL